MRNRTVAYFTMEIALEEGMPTYGGGLGVLAGDTIRSAADLRVPMVVVTLIHRKGYFYQRLDESGWQTEEPAGWAVKEMLEETSGRTEVEIDGHRIQVRAWKYEVRGVNGYIVPVFFLDTDIPGNSEWGRSLTDTLYGGDYYNRICQEAILGMGGVRMLRALGCTGLESFHMNEGHASLLAIELLHEERRKAGRDSVVRDDVEAVRRQCVFTTHTPVAAGHDKFPIEEAARILGLGEDLLALDDVLVHEGMLNMTHLALNLSHFVNGVAKRHGEVSRVLFPDYAIEAITNGVHAGTWVGREFAELYDDHIPGWREDNFDLRYALNIPREEVWTAHVKAKQALIDYVNRIAGADMNPDHLTLGFARRFAPYKRGGLLISDPARLESIAANAGPLQIIYSGKAHPGDDAGKAIIQEIFRVKNELRGSVKIAFLENYDVGVAKSLVAGVDVWVNTPQRPLEASGTSGMKAALNGVPSLSVLDGWWVEGHIEGVTGWSIGGAQRSGNEEEDWKKDADSLYGKLEHVVYPLVTSQRHRYIEMMRHCISLNGAFFNTQRMLQQYVLKAYFR